MQPPNLDIVIIMYGAAWVSNEENRLGLTTPTTPIFFLYNLQI